MIVVIVLLVILLVLFIVLFVSKIGREKIGKLISVYSNFFKEFIIVVVGKFIFIV